MRGPAAGYVLFALCAALLTPSPESAAQAAYPRAQWVIDENAKQGTNASRISAGAPTDIQGYADRVSAQIGGRLRLYVDTTAPSFRVIAFRLGDYGGMGGRKVWTSNILPGIEQPPATVDPVTNMVEAPWSSSLSLRLDERFVQGSYLLKLVASTNGQAYIPLVVRDDSSTAALVLQHQTTTWQAYNRWGGYSLYLGPDDAFQTRSRVVSFDRPYSGRGGGGMTRALPFIALVEGDGMDVTYWTDNDLHARPDLLARHRSLVSLNHDEYWSTAMRDGLEAARSAGVNYANLGANAIYRHIRFEDSPLGADRRVICYKIRGEDPLLGVDNSEVTVNWRDPPVDRPESAVLGAMYQCYAVHAPLVVGDESAWVFAGTGLEEGDEIPGGISGEYDRIWEEEPTPGSVQILAHSPVYCRSRWRFADTTYYTARSGAGVFDMASTDWVNVLKCDPPVASETCDRRAMTITRNVLGLFAGGPAGLTWPSVPNADDFGYALAQPTDP